MAEFVKIADVVVNIDKVEMVTPSANATRCKVFTTSGQVFSIACTVDEFQAELCKPKRSR